MMNPNNPFTELSAGGSGASQNQNSFSFGQPSVFGNTSADQSTPVFGQNATGQSAPAFGNASSGQGAPMFGQSITGHSANMFGQTTTNQSASIFGQITTTNQSTPAFGTSQVATAFGQASSGQLQSAPTFGQISTGQTAPAFGQATIGKSTSAFGQTTNGQSASMFGQSAPSFRQSLTGQSASPFGQTSALFGATTTGQPTSLFSQSNTTLTVSPFGQVATSQSAPQFGQTISNQSATSFGQMSSNQSATPFGQAASNQSTTPFGQATSSQSSAPFGLATSSQSSAPFGQATSSQSAAPFGQATSSQSSAPFGQATSRQSSAPFGQATSNQSPAPFGQATSNQSPAPFGQATSSQSSAPFGQATSSQSSAPFGQATSSQSSAPFGQATSSQSSAPFGQATSSQSSAPFGQATSSQSSALFGQATSSQSSAPFGQATSSQSSAPFGQATSSQSSAPFGQATSSQSSAPFGQATSSQSSAPFGQATSSQSSAPYGQATSSQSSAPFGQATSSQSSAPFGQATSSQSSAPFGQATSSQSSAPFGQATSSQSSAPFGQATSSQSSAPFGQATSSQSSAPFGQATSSQSSAPFGQATSSQSSAPFGQATSSQSSAPFGQATSSQPSAPFGQATSSQSLAPFGQATSSQSLAPFGQATSSQSLAPFGQATSSQSSAPFGQATSSQSSAPFGQATSSQSSAPFGQATSSQSSAPFGQATSSQSSAPFGQATSSQSSAPFGPAASSQSVPLFGQTVTSQSASLFGQSATSKTATLTTQPASIFGKPASIFGQATTESSTTSSNDRGFGFAKLNAAETQFRQVTSGQRFGFGQGSSTFGQQPGSQSSGFGHANSGQTGVQLSFNQSASGVGQSSPGKAPLFGETSGNTVFGQQTSHLGQSVSETHTQMNTESDSTDSKVSTSTTSSTFAQMSNVPGSNSENRFKPPANSTFKPIFGAVNVPEKSKSHGPTSFTFQNFAKNELGNQKTNDGHHDAGSSGEIKSGGNFSFSSFDKRNKDEMVASQSTLKSVGSNFSSFVSPNTSDGQSQLSENFRKEEYHRGSKRKEGQELSSVKHVPPSSEESSSMPQTDHPPVKRHGRLGHQLTGGANLLVRSLYDVVKSHMKTEHKNTKKEELSTSQQPTDSESNNSSQPANQSMHTKDFPASGSILQTTNKVQPSTGPGQTVSGKNQISVGPSQTIPSRTISTIVTGNQTTPRTYSMARSNQPALGRPQPLLQIEASSEEITALSKKIPVRRARRSDSEESVTALSQNELTAIQVRNVPKRLNQKKYLEKYFSKFGKVQRLYCRQGSNMVIVHFFNHTSAVHAKKMGVKLHKDVTIFWHRKKNSPNKKESSSSKNTSLEDEMEGQQSEEESPLLTSPMSRSTFQNLTASRGSKGSPNKMSMVSKTLQFDTESSDLQASTPDTTAASLLPMLSHLVGTVAETSEEKYRLLDQRDRILRQARVKRTELDQAKVFVGTCPDMCPEKERYMRDTRQQLSIYEYFPGTDKLDHAATIKEYSRSSADQEEPLPHELRPAHVLNMTMDYLVTQIMDQGEDNYREWYDFVWNRTRGIRKDITQQHLCDLTTVTLMEKCMRFHIHCAYQLCEEPISSFDPKINNENMTKCLQSLKEMYQDLENRGISCPCEPEFRGYSVLLSLNKGDILREVQQFQPVVRNSADVKFAVQVFAALNSTNFVRFFKLVQSASYLSSCILHGYFNQIRREGLRALNVAYTPSIQRPTSFPMENIMRLLFFHDTQEAAEFLSLYGLSLFDGYVELNRLAFAEPEIPPNPKKCLFINNKCNVSVGEIVNGAPLAPYFIHHPVCSFDAQNKFTGGISVVDQERRVCQETAETNVEVKTAEAEEVAIKRTVVFQSTPVEPTVPTQTVFKPIFPPERMPSPPKPIYSDQDIAPMLEELVEDVLKEYSMELTKAGVSYVSFATRESSLLSDGLFTDVVSELTQKVATEVFQMETLRLQDEKRRIEEEARLKQEREKLLTSISSSLCRDLLHDVLTKDIYSIASEGLQQAVQLDHSARIARCSQDVCDQYLGQFLDEEMVRVARESLREMNCYSKYMQRWRDVLASRKKLRRQMRGFPAAPGSVARDDKLKALIPSATLTVDVQSLANGFLDMGHAGKLSVSITRLMQLREQTFHKMKVQHYFQELLCDAAWSPLDLPPLIVQHLSSWKKCIFWKVVLILPEYDEPNDPNCILSEWLKAKFYRMDSEATQNQEQQIQTLALYSSLERHGESSVCVNVCVKAVHGPITPSELEQAETQKQFLGTSGVVFLLPTRPNVNDDEDDVYWISAVLQLKQLLQAKPFHPPPPLAVLVPGQCQDLMSEVEEELNLKDLVSCGLLSEYVILPIPATVNDLQGTKKVSSAVQFLVSHCPQFLELRSLPLRQYIEDGVYNTFSKHFHHDACERTKAKLPPQNPAAIIDLYNCALSFLAKAVSLEYLSDLSWPVTEFTCPKGSSLLPHLGWNSLTHLAWLKQVVLSFQLPQMDMPPLGAPWLPVCSMILEYVSQICKYRKSLPVLISEVKHLLWNAYKSWEESNEEADGMGPPVQDIPWNGLISLCINHKLREWDSPLRSDKSDSKEELLIYFLEEELSNFTPPETWENARHNTLQFLQQSNDSSPGQRWHSRQTPKAVGSLQFTFNKDVEDMTMDTETDYQKALSKLKHTINAEKEESQRFEEKLQHLLEENALEESASLCLPLYLPEALLKPSGILPEVMDGSLCIASSSLKSTACTPFLQESLRNATMCVKESVMDRTPLSGSLTDTMDELRRQLRVNQQEDKSFEMHLKTLLDVGEL
ncbi:germinal-center associated nuclear protein [Pelobates fuscus]|uniref:germinal-center associated nuclear protein n=1 Tax=Pelobates fuscus TaxID=191477 RepID=UPI002FE471A5